MSTQALEITQRVESEQASALLSTSPSASIGASIVALGFWALFYWQTGNPLTFVWAALIHPIQLLRAITTWRYIKTPPELRRPEQSARFYAQLLFVTSCVWGLAPWLFLPKDNFGMTALMMLVMTGMVSSGVGSLAYHRPSIFAFSIPISVGLFTAFLWQRDGLHAFLAVCVLTFLYTNIKFGLIQNKLLTEALRTRYEKEGLVQQLEEQVRLVELASREKTRFFASASHDLRQPLHSLGLFGSALHKRLKGTADEPIVSNLMHCVDALETSFSAMLDVSKLDAGVVVPQISAVSVSDVFRQLDASFSRQAQSQGLALRFKPGRRWVMADQALLERLLGNLIHNAMKFTKSGGMVVLARRQLSSGQSGVSIEVWDTGFGIADAELPLIFDEFYQVGNSERDRSRGLGMGLAIVRRLSELMGLQVKVSSMLGKGTVFKIWLPASDAPSHEATMPPKLRMPVRHRLEGLHVLVIDDEEGVRSSTAMALRLHGMQVATADGIEQASAAAMAQLAEGKRIDIIICDLRLRGCENGIDAVAQIRRLMGEQTPALLITGDTAPERVRQAQESGLRVQYKPMKMEALMQEMSLLAAQHGSREIGA